MWVIVTLQKGIDMNYKLKKFRVKENESTWWTEKGIPGKADCKIIAINLFYNGRENIPSVIKEVVTNQANGIKNKSLNQQDIEDVRISATLKAVFPDISGKKPTEYIISTRLYWKHKDGYNYKVRVRTVTVKDRKRYPDCKEYFKSVMEKELFV